MIALWVRRCRPDPPPPWPCPKALLRLTRLMAASLSTPGSWVLAGQEGGATTASYMRMEGSFKGRALEMPPIQDGAEGFIVTKAV